MRQITKMVLVMTTTLITYVGVVQAAGRGVDNPIPLYKATTAGDGVSYSRVPVYAGRPNDSSTFVRMRSSDGQAEFAVMEMQESAVPHYTPVYIGRPMDNPRALSR